mgnify:CR=1 FL=1
MEAMLHQFHQNDRHASSSTDERAAELTQSKTFDSSMIFIELYETIDFKHQANNKILTNNCLFENIEVSIYS